MYRKLVLFLAAFSIGLVGCGGGGGGGPIDDRTGDNGGNNGDQCETVADKNTAVYALMDEWYYWYQQMPDVDPTDYSSPDALLDALRYRPYDNTFSYLTTVAEEDAFLNNAAFVGFGFSMKFEGDRLYLRESFEGGPAYEAGMRRGDEIISIDGTSVSSLILSGQINNAFGPNQKGYTIEFEVRHPDDTVDVYEVSKDEVTTPVVGTVRTDLGNDTGYIFFRSFVNPAFSQLDDAFEELNDAGVTRLILDLRYNGGGLLSVTEHLGSLIAGNELEDVLLAEIEFNDKKSQHNAPYFMEALANSANITDLVVITTGSTASASEMIVNGLRPHMNVTTIGDNTYGKPVGQSRLEFCKTEILRAVTFKVVNSEGQGEYFPPEGIAPDCAANDDIFNPLGDPEEASLAEALHFLETGNCSSTASVKAMQGIARQKAMWPEGDPLVRDGWDVMTGNVR